MKRVEGHSNLVKTSSGAVINTDHKAYQRAIEKRKERERINQMEDKLNRIESLLERLLEK